MFSSVKLSSIENLVVGTNHVYQVYRGRVTPIIDITVTLRTSHKVAYMIMIIIQY